jgi:uncharacterized protein (TIGR00369 family)
MDQYPCGQDAVSDIRINPPPWGRAEKKGKNSVTEMQLLWNAGQVFDYLDEFFPQVTKVGQKYEITVLEPDYLEMRLTAGQDQLRPGGSVSGPAQMEMADLAVYFLLLAHHGSAAKLAVTTNLNCSFLRKPPPGDLVCKIAMIKHGRTLSVATAQIVDDNKKIAANMELTYYTGCIYK